jgi:hypothetical protein
VPAERDDQHHKRCRAAHRSVEEPTGAIVETIE